MTNLEVTFLKRAMKNRRSFLKTLALACGIPFISANKVLAEEPEKSAPLVKQPEECDTFFVRENTPITFNLTKSTDGVSGVSLLTEELVPGSVIPMHMHLNEDEFFFFISGTGTVTIGESTSEFKPGTTAYIPRNTWHGFKNTGSEKAVFSFGYSPAGFEDFFREVGTPKGQPYKPKPKEELDRIAKKYGMVFKSMK